MKIILGAIALFSVILPHIANAQINGHVIDNTGEPIVAANVFWSNTTLGTTTEVDGTFTLETTKESNQLITRFIGYNNDTLIITRSLPEDIEIVLYEGVELEQVEVVTRKMGTSKLRSSVLNVDVISGAELCRAACCNLGESFVTNPSVDVSYSDAATGAKQIQLLGLSGTYVQMLTENIPNFRGAAAPYSLGYVPGPWMESIQVSKGISSVKNGYEALTGQINVEYKKPQVEDADWVSVNLFASSMLRLEANVDASTRLNDKWSTMLLSHYENETQAHDGNNDGFYDIPAVEQFNLQNRWAYMGNKYVFQAAVKGIVESRTSGQIVENLPIEQQADAYTIGIETNRLEGYVKQAYIFDRESNTNMALITSGSLHNQEAHYGGKQYNVEQINGYASLMFESEFTTRHALSTGLSLNYDKYDQHYRLTNDLSTTLLDQLDSELVAGAYAQYTYNLDNKFVAMAGIRGDYSDMYGFFVTPRTHIKYMPNEMFHIRLSAGKGYRTNHVLAENNYLLASSRELSIATDLRQEEAWNYGSSVTSYIPVLGKNLTVNLEYFYTDFINQVVIDMDSNAHAVSFSNLDGSSYSHVFQTEVSYPFFEGFTLTAAYRQTDAKCTYNGVLMDKPLTSKYKGLLTASYQTNLGLWQFDATLLYNGGGRMPTPYTLADGQDSWDSHYDGFEQLSLQVTRYFRNGSIYIGGENLTNFTQQNPILMADDPWGSEFDSTMIWGPVHGIKGYIGIRWNLPRI